VAQPSAQGSWLGVGDLPLALSGQAGPRNPRDPGVRFWSQTFDGRGARAGDVQKLAAALQPPGCLEPRRAAAKACKFSDLESPNRDGTPRRLPNGRRPRGYDRFSTWEGAAAVDRRRRGVTVTGRRRRLYPERVRGRPREPGLEPTGSCQRQCHGT
jgi:hypothetical protein